MNVLELYEITKFPGYALFLLLLQIFFSLNVIDFLMYLIQNQCKSDIFPNMNVLVVKKGKITEQVIVNLLPIIHAATIYILHKKY